MARYTGPMIDGGGDDVSVGKLDKKTAKIIANDQAKDPTILLNQLMRRYEDLEKLNDELTVAKVDAKALDTKADELENYAAQARKDAVDAQANALLAQKQAADALAEAKRLQDLAKNQKPERTITFQGFVGECASRRYVIRYSDGTSTSSPAPEDCGDGLGTSTIDNPVSTPTPPPAPTPPKPIVLPPPPPPPPKTAPIDTILFDEEAVPIEIMSDMIFEDIGGHEIINIARNDTINGQTVTYQPIKNLSSIQQQYNPNNVLALQNTSDKYFQNFSIKLDTKLPEEGSGPDAAYIYIEDATGDLIIELINLEPDEQIEVEISLSGTIYEAEFNES